MGPTNQSFEEAFFKFRSTVKALEQRLSDALQATFDLCPSVMSKLRVLELYQELSKREAIKVINCISYNFNFT